jgi:hypothetical protein
MSIFSNSGGIFGFWNDTIGGILGTNKNEKNQSNDILAQDMAERQTADNILADQNKSQIDIKNAKAELKNQSRAAETDAQYAVNELLRSKTKSEQERAEVRNEFEELMGTVAAKKALSQTDLEKQDLESTLQMRMVYAGGGFLLLIIVVVLMFKSKKDGE